MTNAILELFDDVITKRLQKEREEGREEGKLETIHSCIFHCLEHKYQGQIISTSIREKVDSINYYPALEEIQFAGWQTESLDAFEQSVDEIIAKYDKK